MELLTLVISSLNKSHGKLGFFSENHHFFSPFPYGKLGLSRRCLAKPRQGGPGEDPGALATETGGMGTDAWGFWLGNIYIYT